MKIIMSSSLFSKFILEGYAVYLLLCAHFSATSECNSCIDSRSEPGQNPASGYAACLSDGMLSVNIRVYDEYWNQFNTITVLYTCSHQHGNEINNGTLWNHTLLSSGNWLNRTVEVMYHGAMCSIYGCYSSDECNFYKITMDKSECSFEQRYTGINSLTTVLLLQNTLQDYWISQTLTNSLQTTTSTISHQTLTESPNFSYKPVQSQNSLTTEMLLTSPGVPMQTINENGLAVIMPVMLASCTGMVSFSVILLCLIGCKHRHRKLNTTKLYNGTEAFDPYFNPIDVSARVKVDAVVSLYSVHDTLRNESQKNDSETDENSEIVMSVVFSDHISFNGSFIISEENKQSQGDNEEDSDLGSTKPEYILISSLNQPIMEYNSCMSSTNCTSCKIDSKKRRQKMFNISSLPYSINCSNGYFTENEVSEISERMSQPMLVEDKCLESLNESQPPYDSRQVDIHVYDPQMSNTANMFRQFSQSQTSYCEERIIDNQLPVTKRCSGANRCTDIEKSGQQNLTLDELAECNLSLNPSHFEQLDSYI